MEFSIIEISFFISTIISVSLWEYITFQTKTTEYPYYQGFLIFTFIQWIGIGIGMVSIFGYMFGFLILLSCMFVLQYLCHFTLGLLWGMLANVNYLLPTGIFSTIVWILLILAILQ
jgi:hypothetical protein